MTIKDIISMILLGVGIVILAFDNSIYLNIINLTGLILMVISNSILLPHIPKYYYLNCLFIMLVAFLDFFMDYNLMTHEGIIILKGNLLFSYGTIVIFLSLVPLFIRRISNRFKRVSY